MVGVLFDLFVCLFVWFWKARIQGSWTSLNSRLERNKEEESDGAAVQDAHRVGRLLFKALVFGILLWFDLSVGL